MTFLHLILPKGHGTFLLLGSSTLLYSTLLYSTLLTTGGERRDAAKERATKDLDSKSR